jgi:catechol 2,3-dioxygenase-like lactoylglutathione lyase family enzyme
MELFADDLDAAVAFYVQTLGFAVERRSPGYVSVRRGGVVLGLGPVAGLPEHGDGPGFSRARLAGAPRGLGVEIVLELTDFRLTDPDGYYIRVTGTQPV